MTKKTIIFLILFLSLILVACTDTSDALTDYQQENELLTNEVKDLNELISRQEEEIAQLENFTYLNDFTEQELHAYELFLGDLDVTILKDFSPEKIVLLYFHLLGTNNLEAIYAITYDGGTLPEYETFTEQFYTSEYIQSESHSAITFRHYDSITKNEENSTTDKAIVEISASYDTNQTMNIYELQRENNQWKIVLQHLLNNL